MWNTLVMYWREITTFAAVLDVILIVTIVPWILRLKKDATSALAWCLLVMFLPLAGAILFVLLGYQSVDRPLARKRRHRSAYRGSGRRLAAAANEADGTWEGMARLAHRLDAYPLTDGNALSYYYEGGPFFDSLFAEVAAARHHIHIEIYIFEYDEIGRRLLALLASKAREGVRVRLLYDAVGTRRLWWWRLRELHRAGGQAVAFLPVSILRRRFRVNLRNHRKIIVIDGRVAYTGGMNIGDEYAGRGPLGHWRDTMVRIEGPAVDSLQSTFAEDWNFASGESISDEDYAGGESHRGEDLIQVIESGPDQDLKSIREIYFAAVLKARRKLWIITPYYIPDAGLRDAMRLAGRSGIEIKLILPNAADHFHVHYASRYYVPELLEAGVQVYFYTKGFIHSKVLIADGQWASVGTANFDLRSLRLNFEVNCLLYSQPRIAELEAAFERDLADSVRVDAATFARRPVTEKLAENFCRLFSPIL